MFVVVKITILLLSMITVFFMIGLMTTANPSSRITSTFFTNWTSNLDQSMFSVLYSMENRPYALLNEDEGGPSYSRYTLRSLVNIQFNDFKSFIGKELPGFSTYEQTVIVASEQFADITGMYHESGPPIEDILEEREAIDSEKTSPTDEKHHDLTEKVVFLYSSHNRESFLPHLPDETEPDRAYHKEVNITKVSEKLAEKLEAQKIGAVFDRTDITTILHEKGWSYGKSYDASRPVIQSALAEHNELQYVFDIHRDSLPYDKTTLEVDDTSYATFLFVIGAENKQYEKNLNLATDLHYLLEEKLPGISRGVITKEGPKSNGVYNQDLLENSILIEIGGYDNSLDEMYRSIDVFSNIFSEYFWKAKRVNK